MTCFTCRRLTFLPYSQRFPHADLAIAHDDDLRVIYPNDHETKRSLGPLNASIVERGLRELYGDTPLSTPTRRAYLLIDVIHQSNESPNAPRIVPVLSETHGNNNGPKVSKSRRNAKSACYNCQRRKTKVSIRSELHSDGGLRVCQCEVSVSDSSSCKACTILGISCSFTIPDDGSGGNSGPSKHPMRRDPRREKYASEACSVCRRKYAILLRTFSCFNALHRKVKCDGQHPICGPCQIRGAAVSTHSYGL